MLGKWPIPNKLSEKSAWAGGLWIRRVLVRAQEGQLAAGWPLKVVAPRVIFVILCYPVCRFVCRFWPARRLLRIPTTFHPVAIRA
jgi:hypothetical protein